MVSWTAYFKSWSIWAKYYLVRRSSKRQVLKFVASGWKGQYAREVIQGDMKAALGAGTVKVDEEYFQGKGQAGQKWKVFHCAPGGTRQDGAGEKVVIYWHGGAFILGVSISGPSRDHSDDCDRPLLSTGTLFID
jgi:acetyl esterase/lipase